MGTLRTATGVPAVGVRVSAMAKPENPADISNAASLASLAEADESGGFRIENIPPGTCYIVAGRVHLPTYYPGAGDIRGGRLVAVSAGGTVSGVDFEIAESSFRVAGVSSNGPTVTVRFKVEDNGKLPVSSSGGIITIRLLNAADATRTDLALIRTTTIMQAPSSEFRVSVENLTGDYFVKSMTYGAIHLTTTPLKVVNSSFQSTVTVVGIGGNSAIGVSLANSSSGRDWRLV